MIRLSLAEVAMITAGRLRGPAEARVTGVATDSRSITPGDLFVAIVGEHHDGHDHGRQAIEAGAVAVLAERELDVPTVVVADTTEAVGRLARAVIDRLPDLTVVAVTGSSGKTSCKDMLAQVLAGHGPTVAPAGSANNELGLPLTVLRADESTRFLVLEMGARGLGHIAYLCEIAPPDVAVVLNIGSAHVGQYRDQSEIALAKSEIVAALQAGGTAVLNADDALVAAMAETATAVGARVSTFGESPAADVRIADLTLDESARPTFSLSHGDERAEVRLRFPGEHSALNAAAAATAALAVGMPLARIADLLTAAEPRSRWRMEITRSPAGVTVVNDAYNANPESMRAALKALAAMDCAGTKWAVLGEMLELGDGSRDEHDRLGRLAVRLDIARLLAVGEGARPIHLGAAHEGSWGEESAWVPNVDAAISVLSEQVQPGDVVLVKASRAGGLERIAEAVLVGGDR